MKTWIRCVTAAAAISLACVAALQAHHAAMMFDVATPTWVEGTVVRFDRINPHSIITLEERTKDGQVRRWAVEGPDAWRLDRSGIARDFLKAGDVVRLCTFPMKEEFLSPRLSQGADGVPQRWVHGHVLMRNGQKSMWGYYGTFSTCIRSSDEPRESWLAFLNSDSRVQWIWCDQRGRQANQETASSRAYGEEITRLLTTPCG
jgi:hypothetical protein